MESRSLDCLTIYTVQYCKIVFAYLYVESYFLFISVSVLFELW
jgi:hypothetical protein